MTLKPALAAVALCVMLGGIACWGGGSKIDFPPAGEDRYEGVTATLRLAVYEDGPPAEGELPSFETVELQGTATISRHGPDDDARGAEFVGFEITQLELSGTSSLGPVTLSLNEDRLSAGEIRPRPDETDYPVNGFVSIYPVLEFSDEGLSLLSPFKLPLLASLSVVPPEDDAFEAPEGQDYIFPLVNLNNEELGQIQAEELVLGPVVTSASNEEPDATP